MLVHDPHFYDPHGIYNLIIYPQQVYDVVIIGAGCIGGSVARHLAQYKLKTLCIEQSDDVTQGATKGNSGIVHAGSVKIC